MRRHVDDGIDCDDFISHSWPTASPVAARMMIFRAERAAMKRATRQHPNVPANAIIGFTKPATCQVDRFDMRRGWEVGGGAIESARCASNDL